MSFGQNFHHWLHWKLSFWQLPVQAVMEILSKWQPFPWFWPEIKISLGSKSHLPPVMATRRQAPFLRLQLPVFPVLHTFPGIVCKIRALLDNMTPFQCLTRCLANSRGHAIDVLKFGRRCGACCLSNFEGNRILYSHISRIQDLRDLTIRHLLRYWNRFRRSILANVANSNNKRLMNTLFNTVYQYLLTHSFMMTSSNGNIFRVTGRLCGEFTGPRWIPHTKASDAELWCFLWSVSK